MLFEQGPPRRPVMLAPKGITRVLTLAAGAAQGATGTVNGR